MFRIFISSILVAVFHIDSLNYLQAIFVTGRSFHIVLRSHSPDGIAIINIKMNIGLVELNSLISRYVFVNSGEQPKIRNHFLCKYNNMICPC